MSVLAGIDARIRQGSEFLLNNDAYSIREQAAADFTPKYTPRVDFDEKTIAFEENYEGFVSTGTADVGRDEFADYQERRAERDAEFIDEHFDSWAGRGAAVVAREESNLMTEFFTGVDGEGEKGTTGFWAATAPAWWVGGPITKGAGAATRGAARATQKMANQGVLQSARQSMKRATTYMPEQMRPIGGAPARQTTQEGVKGATGSIVRTADDLTTSIGNRIDAVPLRMGRPLAGVGAVGAIVGGAGHALGPIDVTSGNTGATTIRPVESFTSPFGQVIELRDNETVLGYVALVDVHPQNYDTEPNALTVITDKRGTTARESFPPQPTFDSIKEARTAYFEWDEKTTDPGSSAGGLMDMGPYGEGGTETWEPATHTSRLDAGWHLYDQPHEEEDRERFIIAAHSRDGGVIYLDSDAQADGSFSAFKEHREALGSHQRWVAKQRRDDLPQEAPRPDPNADRPTSGEVGGTATTGVLGVRVSNDTLVKAGAALFALALGLVIFGGR